MPNTHNTPINAAKATRQRTSGITHSGFGLLGEWTGTRLDVARGAAEVAGLKSVASEGCFLRLRSIVVVDDRADEDSVLGWSWLFAIVGKGMFINGILKFFVR